MSTATSWWDALGKPVAAENVRAAADLLVDNGMGADYVALLLPLVVREIEHDEPERAQKVLRSTVHELLGAYGNETLVLMTLATLTAPTAGAGQ